MNSISNSVSVSDLSNYYVTERNEVIKWLLDNSFPPLPVVSEQKGTSFTGKNPSYLDRDGKPHLIKHSVYQDRMPTQDELDLWFDNPVVGIGTLGGWNNTIWLDFDLKRFPDQNQEKCDNSINSLLKFYPELKQSVVERTHSGGWRIGVKVTKPPNFKNLTLFSPGGDHLGEAIGAGGFTVLAPTIGPSGNPYRNIHRGQLVELDSLESIRVYKAGSSKNKDAEPKTKQPKSPKVSVDSSSSSPGLIPLEMLLTGKAASIFNGEDVEGDRSSALTTLIREGFGWENWCNEHEVEYQNSTEQLAHIVGERLEVDLDKIERILKSVDSDDCHPAGLHEGDKNTCWLRIRKLNKFVFEKKCPEHIKQQIKQDWEANKTPTSGGHNTPKNNNLESIKPRDRVAEIVRRNLDPSEEKAAFIELSKSTGYPQRELEELARLIKKEEQRVESRGDVASELDNLLKASEADLDISEILPQSLAEPLCRLASWLNLRPAVYLTVLLATACTLNKVGTWLTLNQKVGFEISPNLYAGIVAPSSQKKSPVLKAIIYKPLRALQNQAAKEYDDAEKKYKFDLERYKSLKKDLKELKQQFPNGEPKPPRQKIYYFSDMSNEGLIAQVVAHPEQGLLYLVDELAGIIKCLNQYRSGKGSDEENLLSFYDGLGSTVLRADGLRANLPGINLGIVGGIQPLIFQQLMQDRNDSNGLWGRFYFCEQPVTASELPDDFDGEEDNSNALTFKLTTLYERIDELKPQNYKLSLEASKYFREEYKKLEKLRVNEPSQAMTVVWGKSEGRIGKLALNLHIIHELMLNRQPATIVPKIRIEQAVKLTYFFAEQIRSLYARFAASDSDDLAPHLANIIKLSNKAKGWIKVRDVQQTFNSKTRPKTDEVRSWFVELEEIGKGSTRGSGSSLEFNAQLVDFVDSVVDSKSTAETLTAQGVQPICGLVDFVDSNKIENSQSGVIHEPPQSENIFDISVLNESTSPQSPQNASNVDISRFLAVDLKSTNESTESTEVDADLEQPQVEDTTAPALQPGQQSLFGSFFQPVETKQAPDKLELANRMRRCDSKAQLETIKKDFIAEWGIEKWEPLKNEVCDNVFNHQERLRVGVIYKYDCKPTFNINEPVFLDNNLTERKVVNYKFLKDSLTWEYQLDNDNNFYAENVLALAIGF